METLAPTWNLGHATTAKWYVKLLPSLQDLAFLLPIFILFARLNGTRTLFSDGDTGWHIKTGEWIWAHHAVPSQDLFSFTKSGDAWFAWEWLWDLAAALLHRYAGLTGLALATTLLIGLSSLLVYRLSLRASGNPLTSIAVTALTIAVSSIHWLARPHLVSWIFALVFLDTLESVRNHRQPASLASTLRLPLLTILWTNLHGGFVAGLMIVGCYAVGETLTTFIRQDRSPVAPLSQLWNSTRLYWQTLLLCSAATFVNPYGWQLHKHIAAYLSDAELLDKIQEFQSISFHAGPALFLEILLLLAILALFENVRERQWTPVLLIALWAHFALLSARHIPLFAIVAAPFAAAFLSRVIERACFISPIAEAATTVSEICRDLTKIERLPRLHLASAVSLLLLTALFAGGQYPFTPEFNPETFPAQAIATLSAHPKSRIFTTDQWGDYLLYRLYPAERVFFDGRSDFYGASFVSLNQHLNSAEHDWKSLLRKFSINIVLLKPESPLSAVLKLTPEARVLFDDGKVIVFDTSQICTGSSRFLGRSNSADRASSLSHTLRPVSIRTAFPLQTKLQKG